MKKISVVLAFCSLMVISIFGQANVYNLHPSVISAGDSLGTPFQLSQFEIPCAVYTSDSLFNATGAGTTDTIKTLKYYVIVGDTAGYDSLSTSMGYLLSYADSAVAYSLPIQRGYFTPLSANIFYSLISFPSNSVNQETGGIWLVPCIADAVKSEVTLNIKSRTY